MVIPVSLPFADRFEAGRVLGEQLGITHRGIGENAIVLGLARGGVAVASTVASYLRLPLDVVVVRKLGVPSQPELAMGAVAGGRLQVLDRALIGTLAIPASQVAKIAAKEMEEANRRERFYRAEHTAPDLHDWTVILVDDGLATGSSMLAAVHHVDSFRPAKVIAATPVAAAEACSRLKIFADECLCLATPAAFRCVGEWYRDFSQTTDDEVRRLLADNRQHIGPPLKTKRAAVRLNTQ